jgi:predicted AlkP superfamily pyrophosphatase or phosphodiesterase
MWRTRWNEPFRAPLAGALLLCLAVAVARGTPLLVISVDGLDYRYLRDADQLGLRIPHMRRLAAEGASAAGVVGVVPTVTWPSHTTLISGVPPHVHGILGNRRPKSEGGDYYWSASLLRSRTLLDVLREKGMKSAAVTWPVTVDAPIDFNLPEYFQGRNGGAMDLPSIESKSTPGLVQEIAETFPSFAQHWMNDRTRALATVYLLESRKPDLLLLHLVDHDAEAHEQGPFSREAKAILEYTDELIGEILRAAPKEMIVALVSDHGFERTDTVVNLRMLREDNVSITPFLLIARNDAAAAKVRKLRMDPKLGIGREVPVAECKDMSIDCGEALAVWEPAEHFAFSAGDPASKELHTKPREKGNHGLWPTRANYRSVFVLWGPGIQQQELPEMQMIDIAARFAQVLGVPAPR